MQGTGQQHPGQRSRGYRWDNITLTISSIYKADPRTARRLEGIELQGEVLILGRNTGMADKYGHGYTPQRADWSLKAQHHGSK
jgi:hypothetical protein